MAFWNVRNLAMTATKFTWTFRFHQFWWCTQSPLILVSGMPVGWYACAWVGVCVSVSVCNCVRVSCANDCPRERDNSFVVSKNQPTNQPASWMTGQLLNQFPVFFHSTYFFFGVCFSFRMACSAKQTWLHTFKRNQNTILFCMFCTLCSFYFIFLFLVRLLLLDSLIPFSFLTFNYMYRFPFAFIMCVPLLTWFGARTKNPMILCCRARSHTGSLALTPI